MEIDYIFPRRIFNLRKSARAKILSEWKKAFISVVLWESYGSKSGKMSLFNNK